MQPLPRDHSVFELARNVTMKALARRLPNEQRAVLRRMENMIFEAAVNDSKGDHSMIMGKYNATLRQLAPDANFGPLLLAAKKAFAEQQSIVSNSKKTARSFQHRAHPRSSTTIAPDTGHVGGILLAKMVCARDDLVCRDVRRVVHARHR